MALDDLGELMTRYQAGDGTAFEEIYRRTSGAVAGYLARWAEPKDRDDLVQETYFQVHRARRTFRPDLPFRPWLFAICRHVAFGALRTKKRRWNREIGVDEYPEIPSPLPGDDVLARQRLEAVLARLPEIDREIVWLARVEGLSGAEIGAVVGISGGAVKVRLHRAGKKLREWLGDALD